MAFIQPCFIRKNTTELRKKLEELGYEPNFSMGKYPEVYKNIAVCNFFGNWYYGVSDDETTRPGDITDAIKNRGMIDCGTNEELFIAIASLRDDTDFNQWFVFPKIVTKTIPGYCGTTIGMDGNVRVIEGYDWFMQDANNTDWSDRINAELALCTDDEEKMYVPHKARIEELIEFFKEN